MKIWALLDNRPGNRNQVLGVLQSLDKPYEIKEIRYNKFAFLPNFILPSSLIRVEQTKSSQIKEPWPDLVIAAGRRAATISRFIKNVTQTLNWFNLCGLGNLLNSLI